MGPYVLCSVWLAWLTTVGCAGRPGAAAAVPAGDLPAPASQPAEAAEAAEVGRVRAILALYGREIRSSRFPPDTGEAPATKQLQALSANGVAALAALVRAQDQGVAEVGGAFLAGLVREVDAVPRVCPAIVDLLAASDPRWRALACEALGSLGWRDALPHLQALLRDDAEVPGYAGPPTVAWFAARALSQIGSGGAR